MTEMTKEQRKKELAKYAADLSLIYKILDEEAGSMDPQRKAATIYNEWCRAVDALIKEIRGR